MAFRQVVVLGGIHHVGDSMNTIELLFTMIQVLFVGAGIAIWCLFILES